MYDLELRGHHNMDTGELRRILSQISVHNTICRASIIALPNLDMESMGTVEVQILRMAATPRQIIGLVRLVLKSADKPAETVLL